MCVKSQRANVVIIRSDNSKLTPAQGCGDPAYSSKCGMYGTLRRPQKRGLKMASKKTYPFNGKQVNGQPVDVETSNEPWAQYTLSDGTTVKAKMVMLEAVRLDAYNEINGEPFYQFQFQQIIGVVPPDTLKRKVQ